MPVAKAMFVPVDHYREPRAEQLYNVWRDAVIALADDDGAIPWTWAELDEDQRSAWLLVACEPCDSRLVEFVE